MLLVQLLTHVNPPFTSPTDASIPAALYWLRPDSHLWGDFGGKKEKNVAAADMNNMKSTTAWKGSRPVNKSHKAARSD